MFWQSALQPVGQFHPCMCEGGVEKFRAGFQILFGIEGKVRIFTVFIFYANIAHPFRTALVSCNPSNTHFLATPFNRHSFTANPYFSDMVAKEESGT